MMSKIDLMVLGLVLEKPMHGYEINQTINSEEMQSWLNIGRTSVYYALTRLKKQGLIAEVVERQHNKPDRSVYRITETGRTRFFESLTQTLAEREQVFLEYNIGLFFINKLKKAKALAVLEERREFLSCWREQLKQQSKAVQASAKYPATLKAVLDHTISFAEQEVGWLDEFLDEVDGVSSQADTSVMSISGNLRDTQLADVIRMIAAGGRTGMLSLQRGSELIMLTFIDGEVRYAASSIAQEQETEPTQRDIVVPEFATAPFSWPDGNYVFTPGFLVSEGGVAIGCEVCRFIYEALKDTSDVRRIKRAIPSDDIVYVLSVPGSSRILEFNLSSKARQVLERIDGNNNIKELAELAGLSLSEAMQVLYVFVVCGVVTPVSTSVH